MRRANARPIITRRTRRDDALEEETYATRRTRSLRHELDDILFEGRVGQARLRAKQVWPEWEPEEMAGGRYWSSPVEVREAGGRYFVFVHRGGVWHVRDVYEGRGAIRRAVSRARRLAARMETARRRGYRDVPRRRRTRRDAQDPEWVVVDTDRNDRVVAYHGTRRNSRYDARDDAAARNRAAGRMRYAYKPEYALEGGF
jgi:hypothetical protein